MLKAPKDAVLNPPKAPLKDALFPNVRSLGSTLSSLQSRLDLLSTMRNFLQGLLLAMAFKALSKKP